MSLIGSVRKSTRTLPQDCRSNPGSSATSLGADMAQWNQVTSHNFVTRLPGQLSALSPCLRFPAENHLPISTTCPKFTRHHEWQPDGPKLILCRESPAATCLGTSIISLTGIETVSASPLSWEVKENVSEMIAQRPKDRKQIECQREVGQRRGTFPLVKFKHELILKECFHLLQRWSCGSFGRQQGGCAVKLGKREKTLECLLFIHTLRKSVGLGYSAAFCA